MNIDPNTKMIVITAGTLVFGLIAWRFSIKNFSRSSSRNNTKFNESKYRQKWRRRQ